MIGAAARNAYGVATAENKWRPIIVFVDAIIGFSAGKVLREPSKSSLVEHTLGGKLLQQNPSGGLSG